MEILRLAGAAAAWYSSIPAESKPPRRSTGAACCRVGLPVISPSFLKDRITANCTASPLAPDRAGAVCTPLCAHSAPKTALWLTAALCVPNRRSRAASLPL